MQNTFVDAAFFLFILALANFSDVLESYILLIEK